MKRFIEKLFIGFGIVCLVFTTYLFSERVNPNRLAFSYKKNIFSTGQIKSHIQPTRVVIKNAHIDLPVFPAEIRKNTWDTTTLGVSYLNSSPVPGSMGNSIVYGHNWTSLFGNLVWTKPGDKIQVTLSNGKIITFTIAYTSVVLPTETEILSPSHDSRITLYTCTGFLDSHRFVAVAFKDNK